jgi:hypothetical protein
MKHALARTWMLTGCLVLNFCFDPARAQYTGAHSMPSHGASTMPQAGPASAVIEFENESVVVVRIHRSPHEKTPMHDVSARLVVWLTDAHLRDTHPDGSANETHRRAGTIDWVGVQRHAGENLSDEPLEFLAIVPKERGTATRK